ncbi:MAG: DEAD/DEAH box helicase [Anaerolineae bacterium]
MRLHPLEAADRIRNDYTRYLQTIYFFRDPSLRRQFREALSAPDFLTRGPILEAAAPFRLGRSIEEMLREGILHPGFRTLRSDALPLHRPLYLHQDRAIEKVVVGGRNIVIATGTGSGKTEAFLIPILDHLLREYEAGTLHHPGVRALLLYPMNALANDQLRRLRRILGDLPAITFGRYTGETEEEDGRAETRFQEQFPGEPRIPNELLSRRQMQARPPHILLTNYAMLEYLLLRPQDCVFFDGETGRHWRFLVLDEAHIYSGAEGIEIAMLLRRLKDRIVRSEPGRLRCIATSATLGRGREDFPAIARFAAEIFGERFEWADDDPARQDVIEGEREPAAALGDCWGEGTPSLYAALTGALDRNDPPETFGRLALEEGVPKDVVEQARREALKSPGAPPSRFLYFLLRGDGRLHRLRGELSRPRSLAELAPLLFPGDDRASDHLVRLVDLAVRARTGPEEAPLLPTRYHLFARALEGAFVCLNEAAHREGGIAAGKPFLFLNRQESCPHCGARVFELAACPRCGTAYLVGRESGGRLHQPTLQDEMSPWLSYFILTETVAPPDEDEAIAAGQSPEALEEEGAEPYRLCLRCGALIPAERETSVCLCPPRTPLVHIHRVRRRRPDTQALTYCLACGARNPSGVVYRFLTSRDAPVSVLATTLYQLLPPETEEPARDFPGAGRKLLTFSDNRQDAAFFAPYVEHTYGRILRRRLILKALLEDEGGRSGRLRLDDLVGRVLRHAEEANFFTLEQGYDERRRTVRTWLMQELVALDYRVGLEGLGLVTFRPVRPPNWSPPPQLLSPPWNLSPEEAWGLVWLLLDTLRRQGAMTYPEGVDPRDPAFAPRAKEFFVREREGDPRAGIFGWLPSRGSNRRLDFLVRLLERSASLESGERRRVSQETLQGLWRHLTAPGGPWQSHLPAENRPRLGVVYRLNYRLWEWVPTADGAPVLYRCNRCQAVSPVNLRGICPTYRCDGTLQPVGPDDPAWRENHYRHLYLSLLPIPLQAEEHTAQWRPEEASKVQDRFARGEVNLLSCSTTFELGVDLGSLQVVLMRNVPPTTANYLQRAGRAGRRTDTAAIALTFAQRRSHDLSHYSDPIRLVAGHIHPPLVTVENEKIVRRHVHSVLLSAFFRWARDRHGRVFRTVGDFFAPEQGPTGPDLLRAYTARRPAEVADALYRIVPSPLHEPLGLATWDWLSGLTNDRGDGILDLAAREVAGDLDLYRRLEQEAAARREYREAERYAEVARTVRGRELLRFLGSRNVLPKYGFPTDVVELRVAHVPDREAARVELQRDLRIAIAEYAPGGQVVAAKRVWTSAGIYRLPGRNWQVKEYAVCPECGRYHSAPERLPQKTCSVCGAELFGGRPRRYGQFLIPEFGFLAARETHETGEDRPERFCATRPYFAEYEREPHSFYLIDALSGPSVRVLARCSRYGKLALVNSGVDDRGFRVCTECGWAEPAPPSAGPERPARREREPVHTDPRSGRSCNGRIQTYHLGHEFVTDVLELRFEGPLGNKSDRRLWLSVLYALLEGASEALGIPREDLNGTLYPYPGSPSPALVLFDDVPGGAALIQRILADPVPIVQAAWRRVDRCECGERTSCYQCLRNYYNQFCHDDLRRGLARDFLAQVLTGAGQRVY